MKKLLILLLAASCTAGPKEADPFSRSREIDNRVLSANGNTTLYTHTHDYVLDGQRVEKTFWRDSVHNLRLKADAFFSDTPLRVFSFFHRDTLVKVMGVRSEKGRIVGRAVYYLDAEGQLVYKDEKDYRLDNLDSIVDYQNRERANFAALHRGHQ